VQPRAHGEKHSAFGKSMLSRRNIFERKKGRQKHHDESVSLFCFLEERERNSHTSLAF
jgi:hypothetical protein